MAERRPLIAIVDDEESVRRALKRLLRSAGHDVQTFASGPEFLQFLRTQQPDCLVLDIHMQGMTGFDVQLEINARRLLVPTIIITAFDDPTAETRALRGGAMRFLRKPLKDDDLLEAVSHAVRTSREKPRST